MIANALILIWKEFYYETQDSEVDKILLEKVGFCSHISKSLSGGMAQIGRASHA